MRRLIMAVLMGGLLQILFISSVGAEPHLKHYRKQSRSNPSRIPMIGYLKNEDVYDMCNCAFASKTNAGGLTLVLDSYWKTSWMNIDGEDMQFKLTHATESKVERIGSQYKLTYEADGIKALIVLRITRLCMPYGPECETTNYVVSITVIKGGRRESIKAEGQCGCV